MKMKVISQRALLLVYVSLLVPALASAEDYPIKGYVDGIRLDNGSYSIVGWACQEGKAYSVDVHLYVGGPARTGTFIRSVAANFPSSAAVANQCGTNFGNYRFRIPLSEDEISSYATKSIYIHGISETSEYNRLLTKSGNYRVPDHAPPANVLKILPIGDSITEMNPTYCYRRYLEALLKSQNINFTFVGSRRGTNGGTSEECYQLVDSPPIVDGTFTEISHESRAGRTTCEFAWGINGKRADSDYHCRKNVLESCGAEEGRNLVDFIEGRGANQGYEFDIALIHLGTNDLGGYPLHGHQLSDLINDYKEVVDILRDHNPKVVIFVAKIIPNGRVTVDGDPAPISNGIADFNDRIANVAVELNTHESPVIVVDHYSNFDTDTMLLDQNGSWTHPNQAGAEFMAGQWLEAIDNWYDIRVASWMAAMGVLN